MSNTSKTISTLLATTILIAAAAGSAWAGCDTTGGVTGTPYPRCECNPRGNLSTNPKVNDCLSIKAADPNPHSWICVSSGGCCTAPGECGNKNELDATCNGICQQLVRYPPGIPATPAPGDCGNGVVDGGEECDPGNRIADPPIAADSGICTASQACAFCSCVTGAILPDGTATGLCEGGE